MYCVKCIINNGAIGTATARTALAVPLFSWKKEEKKKKKERKTKQTQKSFFYKF